MEAMGAMGDMEAIKAMEAMEAVKDMKAMEATHHQSVRCHQVEGMVDNNRTSLVATRFVLSAKQLLQVQMSQTLTAAN
jgi:hypothetical protein